MCYSYIPSLEEYTIQHCAVVGTLTLTLIALVWLCSAAISFPAIAWWRVVTPPVPNQCLFTDDRIYLVLSSVVSFYVPVAVILFAYYRIYVTAVRQIRCLRVGSKVMVAGSRSGGGHGARGRGEMLTLRVHRGRYMPETVTVSSNAVRACSSITDDEDVFSSVTINESTAITSAAAAVNPAAASAVTAASVAMATGNRRTTGLRYMNSCEDNDPALSVLLRQDSSGTGGAVEGMDLD